VSAFVSPHNNPVIVGGDPPEIRSFKYSALDRPANPLLLHVIPDEDIVATECYDVSGLRAKFPASERRISCMRVPYDYLSLSLSRIAASRKRRVTLTTLSARIGRIGSLQDETRCRISMSV